MRHHPRLTLFAGIAAVALLGYWGGTRYSEEFLAYAEPAVADAIEQAGGKGVRARMSNELGAGVRHPVLENAGDLDEATRARVARAVADVPGIGGVFWADGSATAQAQAAKFTPLHCQEDVEGLLRSRTIRFEGGSAELLDASQMLLDEVAEALRPCLGAIIAISGHTDDTGPEPGNLALSRERAYAVREALVTRGIPRDGLRARGYGSSQPVEGLGASDPANRRIEFSVIATEPLMPTPVDTPGAR